MEKLARNGLITLDYGGRKADKWIQRTPLTEFFKTLLPNFEAYWNLTHFQMIILLIQSFIF